MIEVIVRDSDNRIIAINHTGHGYHHESREGFSRIKLPNQDVNQFYEETEDGEQLKEIYLEDLEGYTLEETKQQKLEEVRSKAKEIITEKWPEYAQRNAITGIYPSEERDQMEQDITDVIDASNQAEDEVDEATSKDEVGAVEPDWPSI